MIWRPYSRRLLVGALIALLPGCVSVKSLRHADPYVLHHHNWWNYYQRGRLYVRDGKFHQAQTDFQTALGRIPGARFPYAKDCWRARTYGMHMLEGYFPHRELGICLFELNQLPEALELLETSMQMEPSARAKFYLNRIHEKLAAVAAPPRIELVALPGWTRKRTHTIQGQAHGPNPIAILSINDESEFIELATPQLDFHRELPLQEGRNLIRIKAKDVAGRQTATNLVFIADWSPPQIHIDRVGTELTISCRDNLGLHQLEINNRTVFPSGTAHALNCPLIPDTPLRLAASDRAGNRIEWTLSKKELLHLAQNQPPAPPRLHITDAGKTITLYNTEYVLDLRAEDDTALRTVELNGENLLARTTPLFRTLRRIPLAPGTNRLSLAAEDSKGNHAKEQITVISRPPEYMDQIYRLAAALSPPSGEIQDPVFARRISHLMGHELTLDPVRFYLLAAESEMQHLQKEQTLSRSELADRRVLLKQGRKLDSDLVFITRVLRDAPGQTVYTQVLDTRSGEELFIEDIYLEDLHLLPQQIGGLIMKIEQRFPLIQASVLKQENRLAISAGAKNGAQKGMRLLVIRSSGSFEQGRVLQAGNHPAELVISEVESETARVIIPREHTKHSSAQPGDFVFSR
jgi:tetratricopeptide (TPR) repeat protein